MFEVEAGKVDMFDSVKEKRKFPDRPPPPQRGGVEKYELAHSVDCHKSAR